MKIGDSWTIRMGGPGGFGGYCPGWYDNAYPFYGNKNQFSLLQNVDLTEYNILTQGPAPSNLTAGTQAGAVTAEITSILNTITSTNVSFAIGGALLHKISATAVTNAGIFPHTITGTGTITGCDIVHYQGKLLYSYNDSNTPSGDIGSYDLATTFDDDYWTTALSGTALQNAVHYMIVGGDDVCYITNGRYIATLDGTTDTAQGLDFWTDAVVVSLTWNQNRVWAAVNRPNVTGSNFNMSGIYRWNGVSSSWEGDPIEVSGEIGALYTKNGITYVWWKDGISIGGYNFGYIDGVRLIPLKRYRGSLPNQSQVGEYKGFIAWATNYAASGTSYGVMLWGSRDPDVPVRMFPYCKATHTAALAAIGNPFGTLLMSSKATTNYSLAKVGTSYDVTVAAKTIAFNVCGADYKSQIDQVYVLTNNLGSGAKVDTTLTYNQAVSSLALTQITTGYINKILLTGGPQVEDFRLDFSWANGSATNPVQIKEILIKGHYVPRT